MFIPFKKTFIRLFYKLTIEKNKIKIRKNKLLYYTIKNLKIKTIEETLDYIIENRCSVSRYGDGEFSIMSIGYSGFQKRDPLLQQRLQEIIKTPIPNHIICIPSTFQQYHKLKLDSELFITRLLSYNGEKMFLPFLNTEQTYYDSFITRFYMPWKSAKECPRIISRLKQIWNDRDVCIVEGRFSRLGIGNDLFDNAKSIIRIICPPKNAFDKYDEIIRAIHQHSGNRLILIALGMTATVLAYDLAKEGYQAIDVGHVDIEYMWYKMGAKTKCAIPNKYVNEAHGIVSDNLSNEERTKYLEQIITTIK